MNMILTLKGVQNGLYTIQIKKPYGSMEYKKVEPETLYDFIQAHDFYCEANNYKFIFLIEASVKKFVDIRLKEMVQLYNNKSDA